jgi:hypothetical protein
MQSNYVIIFAEKTKCPVCHGIVYLLQDEKIRPRMPMFYICWLCSRVFQVGKGECKLET